MNFAPTPLFRNIILYILLALSIIAIGILFFFQDYRIPLFIKADINDVNRIIEVLSIAYISSFIFYFIVVRLKEIEARKMLNPFIADYTYVLMNNLLYFLYSLRSSSGLDYEHFSTSIYNRNLDLFPSDKQLKEICKNLNPNATINESIGLKGFTVIPHFYGIMIHYTLRIDYFLDILLAKADFMDVRLLRILTDIKTSGYHYQMCSYGKDSVLTVKHRHDHLNVFFSSFRHYFNLFKELENYSERNLKKHVSRATLKIKKHK